MSIKEKAIIVEDRPTFQNMFAEVLEETGMDVDVAATLKEARDLIDKRFYHVAMIDLSLVRHDETNEDGLEVLRVLAQRDEGTVSMVATAYGTFGKAREATIKYGAFDLIEKEKLKPKTLRDMAGAALEKAQEEYRARYSNLGHLLRGTLTEQAWMSNMLRELKPKGGAASINRLANRLTSDLGPATSLDSDSYEQLHDGAFSVQLRSRRLGMTVLCRIGKMNTIRGESGAFDAHEPPPALAECVERLRLVETGSVAGALYRLRNAAAE